MGGVGIVFITSFICSAGLCNRCCGMLQIRELIGCLGFLAFGVVFGRAGCHKARTGSCGARAFVNQSRCIPGCQFKRLWFFTVR
mmetsp:Transcript_73922/g.196991  ORF Transcript_73922/g.196991 Transcript_73922/m.196991 type:complete len:84 (+) Transcript_73922:175-426(+)